eukprot:c23310_g1_i2 orf=148-450(-)
MSLDLSAVDVDRIKFTCLQLQCRSLIVFSMHISQVIWRPLASRQIWLFTERSWSCPPFLIAALSSEDLLCWLLVNLHVLVMTASASCGQASEIDEPCHYA